MNTSVLLALDGQGDLDEGLQETQAFVEDCERRFSRFLPESEVSKLNRSAGEWWTVSDELLDMLILSKAYYDETGGLFDPSILPDLKRAGYDVSMDELRERGDTGETTPAAEPRPSFAEIEIEAMQRRVRMPERMQVDLGGIAKGWIVQEAATMLQKHGSAAAVSAGGDMFFAGTPSAGELWTVEIEDPRDPDRTVATLEMPEGAVVTSSITKRAWQQGGQPRHHIIDPRTGEPAEPEWLSVTVIAPRAHLAEAYAKAFLIGGKAEATRLLLQRPRLAVISVDADGQVLASPNSMEYIKEHSNDGNHFIQQS